MHFLLIDVGEHVLVTEITILVIHSTAVIPMLLLGIFILRNDLIQFLFLLSFDFLGIFIFILELLNISESLLCLPFHSVVLLGKLFVVLLFKQISLLVSATLELSCLLEVFVVVDVVHIT